MYTVQEVAKQAHTTVKTLHYYHKIGLLVPEKTTESGYRLYGQNNLEFLQQILFYKELDFPLKEIKELLDGKINRNYTLLQQKSLLEQKINRFEELIKTIDYSIKNEKKGGDTDMETMFKGFQNEEEWQEVLKEQNEHLKKEYDYDLTDKEIHVDSMNDLATESQAFNEDMIHFLKEGIASNDSIVFNRVKEHLSFLEKNDIPSTPNDFLNQTELFIVDDFHRNMLENWQVGYTYFLNRVAINYLESNK